MIAIKYFFAWLKKNNIINFVPLVFIIPAFTMMFLNIIDYFGDADNNYKFVSNSQYHSYNIYTDSKDANDNCFIKISSHIFGHYKPELTVNDYKCFGSNFYCNIFFTDNVDLLETSFFTKENLLSGTYPEKDGELDVLPDGTMPLLISYNAAKELKCDIGDKVYVVLDERFDYKEIKAYRITLEFTVVGVLKPYPIKFLEEYGEPHVALSFVNQEMFEKISRYSEEKTFIEFFDKEVKKEKYTRIKKDELKSIKGNIRSFETAKLISSTSIVLLIIVLMEVSFIKRKRQLDLKILRLLGMNKFQTTLVVLLMSSFIMGLGVISSLLILKYLYINHIILKYFDWLFLLSIVGVMYLIIISTSLIYLTVSKKE